MQGFSSKTHLELFIRRNHRERTMKIGFCLFDYPLQLFLFRSYSSNKHREAINWLLPSFRSLFQAASRLHRPDGLYYRLVIARAFVNVHGEKRRGEPLVYWARKQRRREPIQPLCYVGARVIKLKSLVSGVAQRERKDSSAREGEWPFESVAKRSFNVPVSLRTPV